MDKNEAARAVEWHEQKARAAQNLALLYSEMCDETTAMRFDEEARYHDLAAAALRAQAEKTEAVAWYVERVAPGMADHGKRLGPWFRREDAEAWADAHHVVRPLTTPPPVASEKCRPTTEFGQRCAVHGGWCLLGTQECDRVPASAEQSEGVGEVEQVRRAIADEMNQSGPIASEAVARAAIAALSRPQAVTEETAVLPFAVKVGHITFGKGVKLATLVNAATRWHEAAGRLSGNTLVEGIKAHHRIISDACRSRQREQTYEDRVRHASRGDASGWPDPKPSPEASVKMEVQASVWRELDSLFAAHPVGKGATIHVVVTVDSPENRAALTAAIREGVEK